MLSYYEACIRVTCKFVATLIFRLRNLSLFFCFFWSPLVRRHLFLTTVYGLYFNHHYTHYKSCWTFCVGSYLYTHAPMHHMHPCTMPCTTHAQPNLPVNQNPNLTPPNLAVTELHDTAAEHVYLLINHAKSLT